ncbi:outer membrane beta-barrel protein [Nibribacter ruber]|uniref:Outer membrane beta-barrel protein n=1 Tax=Nibribacter ruber TaxID=2698458 RepID=A0A6P1P3X4_9BACT|nr:outer membrane beta-barrel protein [Nibribacter ruber]QHL89129.1 outer membrane beta-barrel protein [Nibribacter ruber]
MKHLYTLLFLLIALPGFAQKDFQPGYIVQNGDTLRGLVNQQGDKRQAVLATFKTSQDAKHQNFSPSQVTAYGITNGYAYEAKKISSPDSTYLLFLRVLVKGPASLYFYKDQNSGDHFFLLHQDSLQELVVKKTKEQLATGYSLVTDNKYKKTLFNAFKDCPNTGQAINKLPFKEESLIKMVATYNNCVAPNSRDLYAVKARKSEITYGVQAGAQKGFYTLTTDDTPEVSASSNIGYHAGLMLNITLPWASERISALFEAQYAYTTYNDQGAFDHNNGHTEYNLDLTYHHLKFPISIRYTLPGSKVRPFFNAGAVLNYALSQEERYSGTFKFTYNNEPNTFDRGIVPYPGKFFPGYVLGAGVYVPTWGSQKASVELRYETNRGNSRTYGYLTDTKQVSLTLGIYL